MRLSVRKSSYCLYHPRKPRLPRLRLGTFTQRLRQYLKFGQSTTGFFPSSHHMVEHLAYFPVKGKTLLMTYLIFFLVYLFCSFCFWLMIIQKVSWRETILTLSLLGWMRVNFKSFLSNSVDVSISEWGTVHEKAKADT